MTREPSLMRVHRTTPSDMVMEQTTLPHTIAIDGPAASGKSVLAEKLAAALGYFYFDTGLMYRAVTNEALWRGISVQDERAVTQLAQEIEINILSATDQALCVVTVDGRDVS